MTAYVDCHVRSNVAVGRHAGSAGSPPSPSPQCACELRRPPSSSLLRRALLQPRAPLGRAAIPYSLHRVRHGPAPPASSEPWASSSPGVGSERLGANPSCSQSSGGTGRSFLPLFRLPRARPWRRTKRRRRPAMRRAMAASCCASGARVAANGHVGSDVAVHVTSQRRSKAFWTSSDTLE